MTISVKQRPRKTFTRQRLENDRLEELLDIAAEVFLSNGFTAASTNEIARRANASKATFYSRFPTKEQLFIAVIEHRLEKILQAVHSALRADVPLESALREFGANLIRYALTHDQIALVRLIGMEADRFPTLAQRFFELGPQRGQKNLAAYMQQGIARGQLQHGDPARMAEHFVSLVTGGELRWFALGFRPKPPRKQQISDHLDAALNTFLLAYGNQVPKQPSTAYQPGTV